MLKTRVLVLMVLALIVAACGAAAETVAEQVAEGAFEGGDGVADVDINDDEVTIEFEDDQGGGSMVIGGGDVPDGFPIPVPSGGTVLASFEQGTDMNVGLSYPADRFDELVATYADWIEGEGAENVAQTSTSNPKAQSWFGETSGGSQFTITVVETADVDGSPILNVSLSWFEE